MTDPGREARCGPVPRLPSRGGAVALSAGIEATQAVLPVRGRRCDTDDWSMNTIGALLGAGIAVVVLALDRRRGGARPSADVDADAAR